MRVKKLKHVRRHVRFYKTCCGFREPFKVLCDGNFVHAALVSRTGGLPDILSNFLGGSSKVFVTRCVIAELRKLGQEFSGTVIAARRLSIAKCDHQPSIAAVDCLESLLGKNNPEHFFTATQDAELRRKIRKVPGGGIIFLQNTGFIMEPPSSHQIADAKRSESERLHLAVREEKIIEERARQKVRALENPQEPSAVLENQEPNKKKRKRAKGPNPLSQMKKKRTATADAKGPLTKDSVPNGAVVKSREGRARRRKRPATSQNS